MTSDKNFNGCNEIERFGLRIIQALLQKNCDCEILRPAVRTDYEPRRDFVFDDPKLLWQKAVLNERPEWKLLIKPKPTEVHNGTLTVWSGEMKSQLLRQCPRRHPAHRCSCVKPVYDWTGNGMVEVSRSMKGLCCQSAPSGISVSEAVYWLEQFHDGICILPRTLMLVFVGRGQPHSDWLSIAGDKNAAGRLYEREVFERECNPIWIQYTPEEQAELFRLNLKKEKILRAQCAVG